MYMCVCMCVYICHTVLNVSGFGVWDKSIGTGTNPHHPQWLCHVIVGVDNTNVHKR